MLKVYYDVYEKGKKAPRYDVTSDQQGKQSLIDILEFVRKALIKIAYNAFEEEKVKGFDPNPVIVVDNKIGKSVLDVSYLGKIQFIARASAPTFLRDIYESIIDKSPVDTGQYREHNYVLFKGKQVATTLSQFNSWLKNAEFKDGDQIIFVNVTPYARKLERLGITRSQGANKQSFRAGKSREQRQTKSNFGIAGKEGKFILASNGVYYLTARNIRRKYKNNSKITFAFISGHTLGIGTTGAKSHFRTSFKKSKKQTKPARAYVYPAIKVTIQSGGIK